MSAPTRQEIEAQIAQFLEPWAWETTSYNATVARDDALAKAALIVEAFPALASPAAQPAEADGWVMVPREGSDEIALAIVHELQRQASWLGWEPHAIWKAALAATPKAPATDAGYQRAFYTVAELLAIPAQTRSPQEVWESDMLPALRSLIALKQSAPPAPNDDLRAALEASLAKRSEPTMGDKVWSAAFNAALDMVARDTGTTPSASESDLRQAAVEAIDWLKSAPLESGYCCCGSAVEGHGMGDGHSPVDELAYSAGRLQERLTAALKGDADHG